MGESVRCFWMRITKSVDWVKQIALCNVGGPHPISWKLNETKSLATSQVGGNSSCQTVANTLIFIFSCFWIRTENDFFSFFFSLLVLWFVFLFFLKEFLLELIYNVMSISGEQQSESIIHICLSTLFYF